MDDAEARAIQMKLAKSLAAENAHKPADPAWMDFMRSTVAPQVQDTILTVLAGGEPENLVARVAQAVDEFQVYVTNGVGKDWPEWMCRSFARGVVEDQARRLRAMGFSKGRA